MNRRDFLFTLGRGSVGLAGWVLLGNLIPTPARSEPPGSDHCPRLVKNVVLKYDNGVGELLQPDTTGSLVILCQTNAMGWRLVEHLDGKHSIQSLTNLIHTGYDSVYLEKTETAVVSLIAMLAQAGLLEEPFFVNIHSIETSA